MDALYALIFQTARKIEKRFPSDKTSNNTSIRDTYMKLFEKTIEQVDTPVFLWNAELLEGGLLYVTFTDKVLDLPEKIITGKGIEKLIQKNHYLIEVFRIPITCEPTLINVMKIAFYNGLLMAQLRATDFPDGLISAYKKFQMEKLFNYVDTKDWNGGAITEELVSTLRKAMLDEFKYLTE